MRKTIIAAVLVQAVLFSVLATSALGAEGFKWEDCVVSGDNVPGTKIFIPQPNADKEWSVRILRNGVWLTSYGHSTGYAHAHDGEPYEGLHNGQVVLAGIGEGDCDEETTTTFSEETTTTAPDVTTTTVPDDDVTTTTVPDDVTTTTRPGNPGTPDCPGGQHEIGEDADGNALCAADAEGG